MLIRRDRPKGRVPIELSASEPEPDLDIRHVRDKFPKVKASTWLAERLGRAIAQRRHFITYRQSHHQRLTGEDDDPIGVTDDATPSTLATTYKSADDSDGPTIDLNLSRLSITTGATSFLTAIDENGNEQLEVPRLTRLVLNGIQLQLDEHFECPFCRTIQFCSTEIEWRLVILRLGHDLLLILSD